MKRKIFAVLLTGAMALSMITACSNRERVETKSETKEEMNETVSEEITDEVSVTSPEPTGEPTPEPTEEPTPEPTEEPIPEQETFNEEMAMEKVQRAIECYRKLLLTEDEATWNIIDCLENLGKYNHYLNLATSDGYLVYNENDGAYTLIPVAAMGTCYYEYVNGISDDVFKMSEYISSNTKEDINNKYNFAKVEGETETDKSLFFTAITEMAYLNNVETIEVGDIVTFDESPFLVNGDMEIVYKVPLICDGVDTRMWAAFDKDGNMLNLSAEEDVDWDALTVYTFPDADSWE